MPVEETPFMEKEVVSPVGDIPKAIRQFPDDGTPMTAVVPPMVLDAFTAMPVPAAVMNFKFTVPATSMATPTAMPTTSVSATSVSATSSTCHGSARKRRKRRKYQSCQQRPPDLEDESLDQIHDPYPLFPLLIIHQVRIA
jgi:hypothetical protein